MADSREDIESEGGKSPGGHTEARAEPSLIIVLSRPCPKESHLSHGVAKALARQTQRGVKDVKPSRVKRVTN